MSSCLATLLSATTRAHLCKATKLVNVPVCIMVVSDSILVADCDNNRILRLNASLSDARDLSLPVNTQLTQRMYLDQSRGRLYVGEWSGEKRVLVFDNIHFECRIFHK